MAFLAALAPTFAAVAILMLLTVAVLRGARTPQYLAPARSEEHTSELQSL